MQKVGIVTIIDNNNYGNRLQNYALQETLKKLDYDVYTIKNNRFFNSKVGVRQQIIYIIKSIKKNLQNIFFISSKRKAKFKLFNKNINFSEKWISGYNSNESEKYDFFVVGSDQVWKPTGLRLSDVTLLKFAKKEKKISYAASFGVSKIDDIIGKKREKDFMDFKAISVRENEGKRIVEKYTNRTDVQVLVDPTMLLNADEWNKVIQEPEYFSKLKNKKYILNYFLGKIPEDREKEIERIARENNCEIINILDKESEFYKTGPSEFLFLEKNAFLICTDSFHSCVFSLIFNRPFIVFERAGTAINMNSRINTLIANLHIGNRRFNGKITNENIMHDYTESYMILENEKEKSLDFLRKNLV